MTTQSANSRMTSSIYISALLLTSSLAVSANTTAAVNQPQVSPTQHEVSSRQQQLQRSLKRFHTNKKEKKDIVSRFNIDNNPTTDNERDDTYDTKKKKQKKKQKQQGRFKIQQNSKSGKGTRSPSHIKKTRSPSYIKKTKSPSSSHDVDDKTNNSLVLSNHGFGGVRYEDEEEYPSQEVDAKEEEENDTKLPVLPDFDNDETVNFDKWLNDMTTYQDITTTNNEGVDNDVTTTSIELPDFDNDENVNFDEWLISQGEGVSSTSPTLQPSNLKVTQAPSDISKATSSVPTSTIEVSSDSSTEVSTTSSPTKSYTKSPITNNPTTITPSYIPTSAWPTFVPTKQEEGIAMLLSTESELDHTSPSFVEDSDNGMYNNDAEDSNMSMMIQQLGGGYLKTTPTNRPTRKYGGGGRQPSTSTTNPPVVTAQDTPSTTPRPTRQIYGDGGVRERPTREPTSKPTHNDGNDQNETLSPSIHPTVRPTSKPITNSPISNEPTSQPTTTQTQEKLPSCPDPYFTAMSSYYVSGTQVAVNSSIYQCKPYPWAYYCTLVEFEPDPLNDNNGMWSDAWEYNGPCSNGEEEGDGNEADTDSPTSGSSASPSTDSPTTSWPSLSPSLSPNQSPTEMPSTTRLSPTSSPLMRPSTMSPISNSPTTSYPSWSPTLSPVIPTNQPSIQSSPPPTMLPSHRPSQSPSKEPVAKPPPTTITNLPINPATFSVPNRRFVEWSQLTTAEQNYASDNLSYTESTWNNPGTNPVESWGYWELFDEEIVGARELGIKTTEMWDCHINHYTGFWWEDVEGLNVSQYYEILGWNEYSWDNDVLPATDSMNWYELSPVEQEAAKQLCYNRELWDGIPLPEWGDDEAFIAKRSDIISPLDAVIMTQAPSIQPSRMPTTKQPSLSPISEAPSRQPSESPAISTPPPTESETSLSPTVLVESSPPEILPINPTTLTKPEKRYVEWALLNDFDRRHARELLYIESSWNKPKTSDIESWSYADLYENEVVAAKGLGITNAQTWDCWINHYSAFWWQDLEELGVAQYYTVLGWNSNSWDNEVSTPSSDNKYFDDLSSEEQAAAEQVCYNKELWDGIPLSEWESSLAPSSSPNRQPTSSPSSLNQLPYCPEHYRSTNTYKAGDYISVTNKRLNQHGIFQCSTEPGFAMYCNVGVWDDALLEENENALEMWNNAWVPISECQVASRLGPGEITIEPTRQISASPTTHEPSNQPTSRPSYSPSSSPSLSPTPEPSRQPSSSPTKLTTSEPSTQPTLSSVVEGERLTNTPSKQPYSSPVEVVPGLPVNPATESVPEKRFLQWSLLSDDDKVYATNNLGYDQATYWNEPGSVAVEDWSYHDLYEEEIAGLNGLGISGDAWDCWINHYFGYWWQDIVYYGYDQYFEVLGWNVNNWDSSGELPATEDMYWDELTTEQQEAASQLCYFRDLWDGVSIPNFSS